MIYIYMYAYAMDTMLHRTTDTTPPPMTLRTPRTPQYSVWRSRLEAERDTGPDETEKLNAFYRG